MSLPIVRIAGVTLVGPIAPMHHAKAKCEYLRSEKGARVLADIISTYWNNRGCNVSVWVADKEIDSKIGNTAYYSVRSNLVNGLPRDFGNGP